MNNNISELKQLEINPCPFCNCQMKVEYDFDGDDYDTWYWYWIGGDHKEECYLDEITAKAYNSQEEAIEAYNNQLENFVKQHCIKIENLEQYVKDYIKSNISEIELATKLGMFLDDTIKLMTRTWSFEQSIKITKSLGLELQISI